MAGVVEVLFTDRRVAWGWLTGAIVTALIFGGVMLYYVTYLGWIKGIKWDQPAYYGGVKVASAFMVTSLVLLHVAFWGVWGILTPIIIFTLFWGAVNALVAVSF